MQIPSTPIAWPELVPAVLLRLLESAPGQDSVSPAIEAFVKLPAARYRPC
jgi:hypothetical protein